MRPLRPGLTFLEKKNLRGEKGEKWRERPKRKENGGGPFHFPFPELDCGQTINEWWGRLF